MFACIPKTMGRMSVCMSQCGGSMFTVRSREHLAGRQPCKAPGHHMENTLQGKHTRHKSTYIEYAEKTHISIRIKTQLLSTLVQQQTNCICLQYEQSGGEWLLTLEDL